jgi:hypothetical protein
MDTNELIQAAAAIAGQLAAQSFNTGFLQIGVGHEQFQAPLDIADPRQPHGSTAAGQRGRHRHC